MMEEENRRDDHLHNLMNTHQQKIHPDDRDNTREDHELHHHNELSFCPLFKGLTQSEHDDFLERNVKEILTFKKGETVVRQDDPITFVMLLVQGSVRTEMITQEGNILNIDILEAVIPLAPAFIYGTKNCYPVDVTAVEPCTFLKISRAVWLEEMARNKKLMTNFLTMNADLTLFLTNKLQMISLKSLRMKISTFLLENTTIDQDTFTLKQSRTRLAEYFGVQRQSLARTLKEMEDEGTIELRGKNVKVLDRSRLIRG
ncbi:MAG: Crp/Fnr family transcriptional regulator [Proteiniphilum sp.]|jgi:CRP-like cAMP-binding protein|nr:Crp/Fnr family transcriptional regulator [Proteiniphilum sp.]